VFANQRQESKDELCKAIGYKDKALAGSVQQPDVREAIMKQTKESLMEHSLAHLAMQMQAS
jgi:hypothetical protein